MVTEKLLVLIVKQWRIDFPIVTGKNYNSLTKMQKIRTQRKALRTGLLLGLHGLKKKDTVLDVKLQKFIAMARKKDNGSDYEPDSLRVMTRVWTVI